VTESAIIVIFNQPTFNPKVAQAGPGHLKAPQRGDCEHCRCRLWV